MREDGVRRQLEEEYPSLRRFAAVVGPPDVDPDDLVHDAFVGALRRGLGTIRDLDAYLRRSVLNLSANHRRRWTRMQTAYARAQSGDEEQPAYSVDVAELLALAPEARAVLWLVEVEGWAFSDVAALLGCSEAAARMRASRARRLLRGELERTADE